MVNMNTIEKIPLTVPMIVMYWLKTNFKCFRCKYRGGTMVEFLVHSQMTHGYPNKEEYLEFLKEITKK